LELRPELQLALRVRLVPSLTLSPVLALPCRSLFDITFCRCHFSPYGCGRHHAATIYIFTAASNQVSDNARQSCNYIKYISRFLSFLLQCRCSVMPCRCRFMRCRCRRQLALYLMTYICRCPFLPCRCRLLTCRCHQYTCRCHQYLAATLYIITNMA
jgi:hypothetical protein